MSSEEQSPNQALEVPEGIPPKPRSENEIDGPCKAGDPHPGCEYVYTRGRRRGELCGHRSPDQYPVCRTHRNVRQGRQIISNFETLSTRKDKT